MPTIGFLKIDKIRKKLSLYQQSGTSSMFFYIEKQNNKQKIAF